MKEKNLKIKCSNFVGFCPLTVLTPGHSDGGVCDSIAMASVQSWSSPMFLCILFSVLL